MYMKQHWPLMANSSHYSPGKKIKEEESYKLVPNKPFCLSSKIITSRTKMVQDAACEKCCMSASFAFHTLHIQAAQMRITPLTHCIAKSIRKPAWDIQELSSHLILNSYVLIWRLSAVCYNSLKAMKAVHKVEKCVYGEFSINYSFSCTFVTSQADVGWDA